MKNKLSGFSLMEMLVVLLIIAIVMAASAPMVNRKMLSTMAEKSPWVWTNTTGSIAYNLNGNDNQTTTIGAMALPSGSKKARLYISNGASETPQIAIGGNGNQSDTTDPMFYIHKYKTSLGISTKIIKKATSSTEPPLNCIFIGNDAEATKSNGIAIGSGAFTQNLGGVVIGANAKTKTDTESGQGTAIGADTIASGDGSAALGRYAKATADGAVALGGWTKTTSDDVDSEVTAGAKASEEHSIAIGTGVETTARDAIAIGSKYRYLHQGHQPTNIFYATKASGQYSIALGAGTETEGLSSIAIGHLAKAIQSSSGGNNIAIGSSAKAKHSGSIVIGTDATDNNGTQGGKNAIAIGKGAVTAGDNAIAIGAGAVADADDKIVLGTETSAVYIPGKLYVKNIYGNYYSMSDRRLKNVGEVFTGGLEQIKKLEVFNYTFKKDTEKTPRVGVMAQDLQKIFPNAVFKGEDGFLRIRMEDMFYALVNAVKELDAKVQMIVDKNIAGLKKQIADLEEENRVITEKNAALEKQIASLYEQNAKLEERMNAIEKQLANKKNK